MMVPSAPREEALKMLKCSECRNLSKFNSPPFCLEQKKDVEADQVACDSFRARVQRA